jgi:hypothetical protein
MPRPRVYKLEGSYGAFNGTKVYYLGFDEQPKFLSKGGRGFGGLKHLLEHLKGKFRKFTLTFTPEEDSVHKDGSLYKVRLSARSVKRFGKRRWDANRELNLRLANQLLAEALPTHFTGAVSIHIYQRGMFAEILGDSFDARLLAPEDRTALTRFVTGSAGSTGAGLDIPAAYEAARDVQLLYLRRLVADFDARILEGHDESWWQGYFSKNILYFQDSYIRRLEKLNLIVAGTQFPDFAVVTSDGYLDIIEIKKPGTDLLREDTSRHNFYWSTDIAKAISQVENYIDSVTRNSDAIRNKLRDDGIDLRIIKPRGIVFAGRGAEFVKTLKMADDFRRLNEGLKNVQIIPYDELSQNLKNTIESIARLANEQGSANSALSRKRKSKAKSALSTKRSD